MLRALGDYGRLLVWPANLHMERTVVNTENYRSRMSWRNSVSTEYLSMGGLLFVSLVAAGCSRRSAAQKIRIFGAAWFFLAGCALDLPVRYRKALTACGCAAIVALSVRSAVRSSDWVTAETFYARTMASGGSSCRVSVNLGLIYSSRGDYAKAEAIFRQILQVTPDYAVARNNLAHVLQQQGKAKEAEALFVASTRIATEARKSYPRTWIAALNLAHLQHERKSDVEALTTLEKARLDYPHVWELISFESELLRQTKGPQAALNLVQEFARDHWWHHDASLALGRLLAEENEVDASLAALGHASWLDLHDIEALNLIAQIRVRQNQLEEACRTQRRAVARQPDQPRQYLMLSDILAKMGRADEARATLSQVERLELIAHPEVAAN
jgi:tetratricopeptide (TPR) repeat protein